MPVPLPTVDPDALKEARRTAGISQAKLAMEAGVSPGYVAMIELGQRRPTLAVVLAMAKALAVAPSTFSDVAEAVA